MQNQLRGTPRFLILCLRAVLENTGLLTSNAFKTLTGKQETAQSQAMDVWTSWASTVIVQRQERATFPCFSSLKTGPIYMYMYHIAFSTGLDDTTTILFELPTEIALLLVAEDSLVHTDFHLFRFLLPLASKYSQLCFCENSRKLRLILPEVEEIVNYSSHTLVLRLI